MKRIAKAAAKLPNDVKILICKKWLQKWYHEYSVKFYLTWKKTHPNFQLNDAIQKEHQKVSELEYYLFNDANKEDFSSNASPNSAIKRKGATSNFTV